jgi:hypothetical protein
MLKTLKMDEELIIDNINHPKHYEGNIECIDAMQEVIGKVGVIDFCIGNAFKYIWRCMKKHELPIEDLKKCRWYINKALDLMESEEVNL